MGDFTNKTLLIVGGTGSFGNAVLNRFIGTDIGEIRIFSRDEKKQDDMRHLYQVTVPEFADKIKFFIGDVRDPGSVKGVMHGVDYIFHAAALKQVPSCEFFPMEALKTNVIGLDNVLNAAIDEAADIFSALAQVLELGVDRVLTSGGASGAFEGRGVIAEMVRRACGRCIVMPGRGVTAENAEALVE